MKYHQIVDKIDKVFNSCITYEQTKVAAEYCHRLVNKYILLDITDCWRGMKLNDYIINKEYNAYENLV